jgi:predicted metal-binding protein
MEAKHIIFVCTTCASHWENGKQVGISGGEKLFQQLQENSLNQELSLDFAPDFAIEPVSCMSACSHSCVISLASQGKYTYLFGGLSAELSQEEIAGVFECANKYGAHPQGLLPWSERPEPLKKGVLARIPAMPTSFSSKNTEAEFHPC